MLETEPVRPRQLDRRVPRDLETIVLKAMEKDPGADTPRPGDGRGPAAVPRRRADPGAAGRRRRAVPPLGPASPGDRDPRGGATAVLIGATIASVLVAGRMAALAKVNERAAESEHGAKAGRADGPGAERTTTPAGRAAPLHRPDRPGRGRPPPVRLRHGPQPAGPVPPRARRAGPPRLGVVLPRPVVPSRAAGRSPCPPPPTRMPSP